MDAVHVRAVVGAVSAEPTAEQRAAAKALRQQLHTTAGWPNQDDLLARALAAAVTAEREKYLRVADELWKLGDSLKADAMTVDDNDGADLHYAARRIREVTT